MRVRLVCVTMLQNHRAFVTRPAASVTDQAVAMSSLAGASSYHRRKQLKEGSK